MSNENKTASKINVEGTINQFFAGRCTFFPKFGFMSHCH